MQRRKALKKISLMLGASMTIPASMQLLSGCNAGDVNTWRAVFFDDIQFSFVAEVAETILPRTDTPGAKDVNVPQYIDLVLSKCYSEEVQLSVKEFINSQVEKCHQLFNRDIQNCSVDEQITFVKEMEELTVENPFSTIKGLVLLGYFTSEEGMKQSLNYNAIPQRYDGCVTIDENAKVYVDNNVHK